jgi:hypothetical protein
MATPKITPLRERKTRTVPPARIQHTKLPWGYLTAKRRAEDNACAHTHHVPLRAKVHHRPTHWHASQGMRKGAGGGVGATSQHPGPATHLQQRNRQRGCAALHGAKRDRKGPVSKGKVRVCQDEEGNGDSAWHPPPHDWVQHQGMRERST